MRKPIFISLITLLLILALVACGNNAPKGEDSADSNGAEQIQDSGTQAATAVGAEEDSRSSGYDAIKPEEVPADYPADLLPLSNDDNDKTIAVYTTADGATFALKIATTRTAKEVVEEYAGL